METGLRRKFTMVKDEFKSYYVVWKPQANDGRFHQHIQFKSYYVVWKPNTTPAPAIIAFSFKSYYVVWKPLTISHTGNTDYSLNRTM